MSAADPGLRSRLRACADVARFAPSKHNTQPWRFVLRSDALEVHADPARDLPLSDATGRERTIAIGAAVELAVVAGRAQGDALAVALPDQGPVAVLTRAGPHRVQPVDVDVVAAARLRRTDRGPLDAALLSPATPFLLQRAAARHGTLLRLVTSPGEREALARLGARADRALALVPGHQDELDRWLREDGQRAEDGVLTSSSRGPVASYRAPFVQRSFTTAASAPQLERAGADAPLLCVLVSPTEGTAAWFAAGRALMDALLVLTGLGGAASFLDQAVEEPDCREALRRDLSLDGWPQVVLRCGRGGSVAPAPRRPLDAVLEDA